MEDHIYKRRFKKKTRKLILIPLAIAAFLAVVSYVVMLLWNNLLPGIMNVTTITFWQAMGIFILCKILFGFGKGGGASWREKFRDRCKNMTPEERVRFRDEMENRWCGWKTRRNREHTAENTARPSAADETAD